MITKIADSGLLKFTTVGGFDPRILPGKGLLVGKDKLPGVIGLKAIHNTPYKEMKITPKIKSLAIDIGATKKEQASAKITVGDYAVFDTKFEHLNNSSDDETQGVVKGKALDDRVGCAMLVEILQKEFPVNVVGVFTVQEEVGLRGAHVAAHKVNPDLAITLECTSADDLPFEKDKEIHYPRLGEGPCLTIMDRSFISNKKLLDLFEATADKQTIPYQYKQPALGGTDSGAIHKSRAGVPAITIAVPSRYIHSPVALINLIDFWNCIKLVEASINELVDW